MEKGSDSDMVKEEKTFLIPESLGNAIIQFLSKLNLPVQTTMQEVAPLINGLANLQEYEGEKDDD